MGTSIRNGLVGVGVGVVLCLLGLRLWAANGNPFLRTTARSADTPIHVIGADEARVQVLLHRAEHRFGETVNKRLVQNTVQLHPRWSRIASAAGQFQMKVFTR